MQYLVYLASQHTSIYYLTKKLKRMASNSETGHAINIANFKQVVDKCTAFGATYNPGRASLSAPIISTQWTGANNLQNTMLTALAASKQPINDRAILFKEVEKGVTRIVNALYSTEASKEVKKDAKGLADKFRGIRPKKPKVVEGTPTEDSVSQSHQSFVQKADTFKLLVELLKTVTEYTPNETELTTAQLDITYDALKAANDGIGTILTTVQMARIARNKALYEADNGIVDVAQAVKKYVKSVYGATAAEFKAVNKIKFTRIKT
jgi:hypothetical protein